MSSRSLIARIVAAPVATAETWSDLEHRLHAAEEAAVAWAVASRRREFATVRACAHRALHELGVTPEPLVPGDRGAPGWPVGVVGSLTHTDGYRAAAVARATDLAAIGIDAEPHEPLPPEVLPIAASTSEQAALAELARTDGATAWGRLLFSAKESVYKVWSPATGLWLDHEDVVVDLRVDGTFTASLLRPGLVLAGRPVDRLTGAWAVDDTHLLTAVVVPAGG